MMPSTLNVYEYKECTTKLNEFTTVYILPRNSLSLLLSRSLIQNNSTCCLDFSSQKIITKILLQQWRILTGIVLVKFLTFLNPFIILIQSFTDYRTTLSLYCIVLSWEIFSQMFASDLLFCTSRSL